MKLLHSKSSGLKNLFAGLLLIAGVTGTLQDANAQSPTSFGRRVKGLPKSYQEPNAMTNTIDKQSKSRLPWIVFSDRSENNTTTSPGGSLMMEKIEFLQPFYVSDEKEGYLKLLRYQDNMVKGLKLKNKKGAESVGWISKDKLLLWQKSYIDVYSRFPQKFLTIINDIDPLVNPAYYFDRKDSVFVYDGPDLKNIRTKVALHNYVYVFKKSSNGKQLLIGTADQFVTRHAEQYIKGWVASSLVENWGSKVYIAPVSFEEPEVNTAIASIKSYNQTADEPYRIDPLLDTTNITLTGLPVTLGGSGDMRIPMAVDVYNKENNKVLTINGSEMTFPAFLNLMKNRSKVNIVFVIDGGGTMKSHFASLLSTIQSFETIVSSEFSPRSVRYGSVVYRQAGSCGNTGILPLTKDYRQLMAFLREQSNVTAGCPSSNDNQPVFSGLGQAADLVSGVAQQTNLFVVVGATGNAGGSNTMQISSLARRIADVDGRLLVLQSHNRNVSGYTDFIMEARKLVSGEAYYAAEKRKFQLVEGEAFGQQVYDFNLTDSISYYLDFPNASLVQGGVVFPSRGATLQAKSYQAALTRFMKETKLDIRQHLQSLEQAFRITGIENKNVSNSVRRLLGDKFNPQVGDNMPHNVFKFASPVELSAKILTEPLSEDIAYNLILNQNEYSEFMDIMNTLVGSNLQADDKGFRRKLHKNYRKVLLDRRGRYISSSQLNRWSLGAYMEQLLGVPRRQFPYDHYTIKALYHKKQMSLQDFEKYIAYLQETTARIKAYAQEEGKFLSNGETYYRIPGYLFNPKID